MMSSPTEQDHSAVLREAVTRKGSFLGTMRAVFWSFFGVRRGKDYASDVEKLNPVHVVVAGLIGGVVFVLLLVLLVQWVIHSQVAG